MKNFKMIDHTADIAMQIEASNIEEFFSVALEGYVSAVFEVGDLLSSEKIKLQFCSSSLENLLVEFLNEANYYVLVKNILLVEILAFSMSKDGDELKLDADLAGYKFDQDKTEIKEEIKAITYHQMKIEKHNSRYKTIVIFDI